MVGVVLGLKIQKQRRVSIGPQGSGPEDRAFQTMR